MNLNRFNGMMAIILHYSTEFGHLWQIMWKWLKKTTKMYKESSVSQYMAYICRGYREWVQWQEALPYQRW